MKRRRKCFKIYGVLFLFAMTFSYPIFTMIVYRVSGILSSEGNAQQDTILTWHRRKLLANMTAQPSTQTHSSEKGEYPDDIFTMKQREQGAVVLHIIGILYMFLALSIVCDEFFVPALHVISDILAISDDVAGATFMAAGGSAPELFTSILGVFVAKSNIGFGTIVGSAVFNILFVIGMCVVFSKTVLHLTWWPLLRDTVFYIFALGMLISFFQDSKVHWWESLILLAIYFTYVVFMYFNQRAEAKVKYLIAVLKGNETKTAPQNGEGIIYRNGALQLVIHTLDPISEASAENKFHRLKEIIQSEVLKEGSKDNTFKKDKYKFNREGSKLSDDGDELRKKAMINNYISDNNKESAATRSSEKTADTNQNHSPSQGNLNSSNPSRSDSECSIFSANHHSDNHHSDQEEASSKHDRTNSMASFHSSYPKRDSMCSETPKMERTVRFSGRMSKMSCVSHHGVSMVCTREAAVEKQGSIDLEDEEPLSLEFPKSNLRRAWYILRFPIVILLFITLPDVRKPKLRKFFPWTFLGSIIWIAGFTYFMVWWATMTGETLGIPPAVMGLTFLAAGTSIPDLITSVLVAREGLGDMAVSSSIGSNIFDVTVGLPVPWLIYSAINSLDPMIVNGSGLFCSVILLFLMLIAVIASIAIFRWRMTKHLAIAMFSLYAVFLTLALLLEFDQITCFL